MRKVGTLQIPDQTAPDQVGYYFRVLACTWGWLTFSASATEMTEIIHSLKKTFSNYSKIEINSEKAEKFIWFSYNLAVDPVDVLCWPFLPWGPFEVRYEKCSDIFGTFGT